jgi:predicted ATP-grasp superfamily ATP-dependent carboligase
LSTNILLTSGRAPITLELARLFSAAGYKVFVADSMKHHLCSLSQTVFKNFLVPPPKLQPGNYIAALVEIIKQEKISLLIPTCEDIFYVSHGLPQLTPHCQVFAEPLEKLNRLHNKWDFICRVENIGLTVPKTWLIKSQQDLIDILNLPTPNQLILKPVYSRFASNIHIVTKPVNKIPDIQINETKTWVAQQFIAGKQYCSYSIAHRGKLTAHAVYPTAFTAGKGSCIYFESVNHPQILQWVQKFVEAENFTGQIAFDFIESIDKMIYPLECNPRAISAIHLFQESDKLEQAFLNSVNNIIQPQFNQRAMIAMAMLIYGFPSSLKSNQIIKWIKIFLNTKDVIFRISDPMPFWSIWVILWQSLQLSLKTGLSLQEVSTQDIEWNGENIYTL